MSATAAYLGTELDIARERDLAVAHRGEGNAELLEWCPTCVESVVALRNRTCPWCDTEVIERAPLQAVPDLPAADQIALEVITDEAPKIPPRRDRRHNHGKPYTDEQLVARIRLWARVTGAPPSKSDWTPSKLRLFAGAARARAAAHLRTVALYEMGDWPSETAVRDRFGSFSAALVAAGFEPRPPGRPPRAEMPQLRTKPTRTRLADLFDELEVVSGRDREREKAVLYELAQCAIGLGDLVRIPERPGWLA